jgi:hypothetical protein
VNFDCKTLNQIVVLIIGNVQVLAVFGQHKSPLGFGDSIKNIVVFQAAEKGWCSNMV